MVATYTGCLLCLAVSVHCLGTLFHGCFWLPWICRLPWTSPFSEASPSCNAYHWQLLPISSPSPVSGISPSVPCSGSGAQQNISNLGNVLGQRCKAVWLGPSSPPWASPGRSPDIWNPALWLFFINIGSGPRILSPQPPLSDYLP